MKDIALKDNETMLVEDALTKESVYDLSNKTTKNDKESQDQNTDSLENKTNEGNSLKKTMKQCWSKMP